jgi:hypothetical protein
MALFLLLYPLVVVWYMEYMKEPRKGMTKREDRELQIT